jgi:hypothetical protein
MLNNSRRTAVNQLGSLYLLEDHLPEDFGCNGIE